MIYRKMAVETNNRFIYNLITYRKLKYPYTNR